MLGVLVVTLSLVGQAGGTGITDNGFDVPSTVYFTNPLSGASRVPLTYTGRGWEGSEPNLGRNYCLSVGGFRIGGVFVVTSWHMGLSATVNGIQSGGQVDMFSGGGLGWRLQGTGLTVDSM